MNILEMAKRAQKGFELAAKPESPEITEEHGKPLRFFDRAIQKGERLMH